VRESDCKLMVYSMAAKERTHGVCMYVCEWVSPTFRPPRTHTVSHTNSPQVSSSAHALRHTLTHTHARALSLTLKACNQKGVSLIDGYKQCKVEGKRSVSLSISFFLSFTYSPQKHAKQTGNQKNCLSHRWPQVMYSGWQKMVHVSLD